MRETMELHHSKHHAGYTAKLNAAIEGTEMDSLGIGELTLITWIMLQLGITAGVSGTMEFPGETMSPDGGGEP